METAVPQEYLERLSKYTRTAIANGKWLCAGASGAYRGSPAQPLLFRLVTGSLCVLRYIEGERAEMVGVIMEAIAAEGRKNILPTYYDVVLSAKYAQNDESIENDRRYIGQRRV